MVPLWMLLMLFALAFVLLLPDIARAEGSKDLVSQGGARAYLDYREATNTIGGIARRSTIYVYAQQGERIWLGSSANGVGSGRINYTAPNSTAATSCATTSGVIASLAQEQAGPNATGGFTPCSVTVGTGQAGVWKIEFTSPNPAATANPPATPVATAWTQPNNVGYVSAWDVTVRNSGNTASIPGRAYANYLALITGANGLAFNPDFYIQSRDGYRYRLDPNGLDPNGFVLFANNKGFRNSSGSPLYRSVQLPNVASLPSGVTLQDPGSPDTASDVTHKLFLNTPASDLPGSANITGGTTWLVNSPEAPPSVSNLTFSGSEGTSNQAAPGQGGTFTYQSGANNSFRLVLDLNRDGTYGNGNDRVLIGSGSSGTNSVAWDGLDGNGNVVSAGGGAISATVTVYAGEIHFPVIDAENNPNGTIIQRLIPSTDYTVYYNDSGLTGDNPPSPLQNLGGESSQSGSHEWGNTSATGFGNEKGIDTWAYGNGRTITLTANIQIKSADLEVVTNTDNQATTKSGNQISYTITVRNNGPSDVTGANFSDNIPTGVNNVTWTCSITTGTGSCGTSSGSGNAVGSLLNLNSGAVATFTVTGTVAADAPATLSNTATITRPDDVADSNANNNSSTDTTTVNRAPVANDRTFSTNEDANLSVNAANGLLSDATDADSGQTLTPSVVSGPSNGTLNLNADGSFTYNPNANFNGTDTFTYRVCDNGTPQACSPNRTVTLTVNAVNDPPTATNDSRSTNEDTALTFAASTLTANDSPGPANESGQTLTVTSVGNATNGTVSLTNGQVTFTPNANFNGAASFIYTVSDGQGGTATATVNITVAAVNDAPDAVDDSRTTNEDTPLDINVLANDTDVENNTLSVTSITQPTNGTATIITSGTNAGQVRYTPNSNFSGTDTFTYAIGDGNGGTDTATVTVTVSPVNDVPVNTVPGAQTTNEDTPLVFSASNNNRISIADPDAGNNPLRVTLSVPQNAGTLTLSTTTGLTFTTGDGTADRTMTFAGTSQNVNSALAGLRFDPASNFNGSAPLTITTNDQGNTGSGGALEDTDTVAITVSPVNDAPTLSQIADRSTNEDTATAQIPFTFSDVETTNANLTITATSSNTNLVPNANIAITRDNPNGSGYLVITPAADQSGTTTITLTIRDADGATTTRTFVLTVEPVNDPPRIDLDGQAAGTGYSGSFTENGGAVPAANPATLTTTDVDNTNLQSATVTLTNRPDGNAVESLSADVNGTGITASYNQTTGVLRLTGPATVAQFQQVLRTVRYNNTSDNPDLTDRTITFVVNDGTVNSNTATSTLTITRANDAPDAQDNAYTTAEDTTLNVAAPGILTGDTDADGDTLTVADADPNTNGIQPVTGVQHGTLTLRANGSFDYVPNADYFGTDSFTYRISDGNGGTDEATVNITVTAVNDAPIATDDTLTIAEDQTLNFAVEQLVQNDSAGPNEGNQTLTVTRVFGAQNGTVELTNGRVIFTPDTNFNGPATFRYTVSDGQGGTANGTVTVDVTPINDVPVADDDAATTDEDTPVRIDVVAGGANGVGRDTTGPANESGQTLTVQAISVQPQNGTASINDDNTITYTPNANFRGTDTFVYAACDNGTPVLCDRATVTVTVNGVNDAPVAEDDVYEIDEDQTLNADGQGGNPAGVLINDRDDVDGDQLRVIDGDGDADNGISPVRAPQEGTLTLNANGTFVYNPRAGFSGTDTFTYRISDGNGGTDVAEVTISTEPINDLPEADNDSYTTAEDTTLNVAAPGILTGDTDADGDTLTVADADPNTNGIQPVTGVQHGTLTLRANGSFDYVPNADYFGTDSFTYRISDGNGGTDEATVNITVTAVNDAPIARSDRRTIPEDQTLNFPASELTANDSAGPVGTEGNQTLTVTEVFGAQNGTVTLTNGRVIFTPDNDYFGQARFSYRVCDNGQTNGNPDPKCSVSEVNIIDVTPVNDPPVAADDEATTDEDQPVTIDVIAGDANGDGEDVPGPANESGQTLAIDVITSQPTNGSVRIASGGIVYTPNDGFSGTDTFEYRVCDNGNPSRCDEATVTVTVSPVNDAPVNTVPGAQTTNEDTPLVFSASNNNRITVSDPDSGDGNVRVTLSVPQNAGTLTVGPQAGVTVSGNDTDTVTLVGDISDVSAAIDGLVFDPASDYSGPATLTVTTNDRGNTGSGGALEDTDTVDISVGAVNDAPTLSPVSDVSTDEDTVARDIPFSFDDIETGNPDLTFSFTSSNTNLVPNANIRLVRDDDNGTGNLVITPARNQSGTATITLTVTDGGGATTTRTFVLTVDPVNDAPVNDVPGAQTTDEDTPLVFDGNTAISVSDVDAATGEISVTVSVPQGDGEITVGQQPGVVVNGDGTNSVTLTGTLANVNAALDGLTYRSPANANGIVTLTISTNDNGNTGSGGELTDRDTVEITVEAENDPPTFDLPGSPDQQVDEDSGTRTVANFARNISAGDNEPDQSVRFEVTNDNNDLFTAGGQPSIGPGGTLTYTPARNAFGTATVTVTAIDDNGTPNDPTDDLRGETITFTITVTPVNDAPTVSAIGNVTIDEDQSTGGISFTVGDVETPAAELSVTATSSDTGLVPNGNIRITGTGANRVVNVTPAPDQFGSATITVTVRDALGVETTEEFVVTVRPVNDGPTATRDTRTTQEDTPLTFPASALLENDSSGPANENQNLTVTSVGGATNGTVRLSDGQITFTPDRDFNGQATFTYTISDGNGGTDTATVTINVRAVNDAPVVDLDGSAAGTGYTGTFDEDGDAVPAADPADLTATDADDENFVSATVRLENNPDGVNERLAANVGDTGLTATYDPQTGTLTIEGDAPKAAYQRVLRTVTYDNTSQNPTPGERNITFVVDDGDLRSAAAVAVITVSGSDDVPVITLPGGPVDYTENGDPISIDPGATVADPDTPNFGGGSLTVRISANETAADRLAISEAGDISTNGNDVLYAGTVIGTFTGGQGTTPLTISFDGDATREAVEALIRNITFANTSDDPSERPRTVSFTLNDGEGNTGQTVTTRVNVEAVNDAPTVDLNGGSTGTGYTGRFTEDGARAAAASGSLSVSDPDDANIEGATVTLTNRPDGNGVESLAVNTNGTGIVAVYDPASGTLTLTGTATKAEYQQVLRTVTYGNTSQNPDTTNRRIEFIVNDGDLASNVAVSTIIVDRANDAPDARDNSYTTDEDTTLEVPSAGNPNVLGNDIDADGDTLTVADADPTTNGIQPVRGVRNGTLTLNANGTFTYEPNADFNGTDSFVYRVSDGNGGTSEATVNITVTGVNDDPTARDDADDVPEDSDPVEIDVLANDTDDPDTGETLTITSVTQPDEGGTVAIVNGGTAVRFTPAPNFEGEVTFTYTISDGNGGTDTGTVTVIVGGENDSPEIGDFGGTVTFTENGQPVRISPDATLTDPDSPDFDRGTLNVLISNNGQSAGRINIRNQGDDAGEIGLDGNTVTYGGTPIGTFTPGSGSTPLQVTFNENATRAAVEALIQNITYSNVSENPSGAPRTVTLTLTDGDGGTETVVKRVQVVAVPDAPVVRLTVSPETADEGQKLAYEFTVTDPDSDTFTVVRGSPACGTGGELVAGSLQTTANGGTFRCRFPDGPASPTVSIQVQDPDGVNSNVASRTVAVSNLAPVTDPDGSYGTDEDTLLQVSAANGVLDGDTDAGGDPLVANLVEGPPAGAGDFTLNPDGSFTFDPADDFNGSVRFTYRACEDGSDPLVCSEPRTVTIVVGSVNDAPLASPDTSTTREDESKTFDVVSNDSDRDGNADINPASLRIVTQPANGSAAALDGGRVTYTPNADFNGTDTFTYEICDRAGSCDTTTVRVTVDPVNDAPVAENDRATTPEDTELRIPQSDLLRNDTAGPEDEDAQTLRITAVGNAVNGSVRLADNGDVIFTPAPDYSGPARFDYTVRDNAGNTDTATAIVRVTVAPVNDAPVGNSDSATTDEDSPVLIDVLENDTDTEGDTLSIAAGSLTQPRNGTIEIVGDEIRYIPNENFNGTDTFTYRASDGNGGTSAPVTVRVRVQPENDAPNGNTDSYSVVEDGNLDITAPGVLANDDDVDGDDLTVTLVDDVENGTLDLNDDGSFTYTPNANYTGNDSFTYTVSDGNGGTSAPIRVSIAVGVANDAPVAVDDGSDNNRLEVAEDGSRLVDVLANDTDVDGDDLSIRSVGTPRHGTAVVRDGQILYTPDTQYNGPDSFTYTVVDENGETDEATVYITVTPVNDPPVAVNDQKDAEEDTPLTFPARDLLANDRPGPTNESGQALTVVSVGDAQNGTVRLVDGEITFTPAPNYSGPASFTYTVRDNAGNTDTATAFIDVMVRAVNDPPEAIDDPDVETGEDDPTTIEVLANDSDPEGDLDPSSVRVTVQPDTGTGTATANADGTITYDPPADFNGIATFTYEVCDTGAPTGNVQCDTATVTVEVGAVNDAPVANDDDDVTTDEDELVDIDVLDNDDDPDGPDSLDRTSVSVVRNPTNGTTSINSDGTITYRPNDDFSGTDTFIYEVCDTGTPRQCDTATVTIEVTPVNDPPNAADRTVEASEGGRPVRIDVLADANDPEDDDLTITSVTQPESGQGTTRIVDGRIVYTPNADFSGQTTFTYTISDGNGGTDTATVTVNVSPTNDDPTASDDTASATEGGQPVEIDALDNDRISPDTGETLTISDFTQPPDGEGTVELVDGRLVYTPNDDFNGTTSFRYTVSDGNGGTDTATVTINVAPTNDPVVASPDRQTVDEDGTLEIRTSDLTSNDSAGDSGQTLTVTEVGQPENGTVTFENGVITYTPDGNFTGTDSFTYTVCDNGSPRSCDTATVTVTVNPVNDAPDAKNDSALATEGGDPVTISVLRNDTDPDGNTLTISDFTQPASGEGSVRLVNGRLVYTPDDDFNGVTTFQYTISDGNGGTDTATVTITVGAVNDAVTAEPDSRSVAEDGTLRFRASTLTSNDSAGDTGQTLTVTEVGQPENGTVTLQNGIVTYTPDDDFSGTDSFSYTVCDDGTPRDCATSTVNITVTPVNDAPNAINNTARATEAGNPVTLNVLANDTDPDADELTVSDFTQPPSGEGTVELVDGRLVYTPNDNFNGTTSFQYTVSDGNGGTDTATVTITVGAVNDDPVARNDSFRTPEDTPLQLTQSQLLANDDDGDGGDDGQGLTVTSVQNPRNGTVRLNDDGTITFTPAENYNGTEARFTYTVSDGQGNESTATAVVRIAIDPANDAPNAINDRRTVDEDSGATVIGVRANDTDADGDTLNVTEVTQPTNGTVRLENGIVTYTPDNGFNGTDTFTYTVSDGNGGTDTATVSITVRPVNDPVEASPDGRSVDEDGTLRFRASTLTSNDSAGDTGQTLTVTEVGQPENGTVTLQNGVVTYRPNANFSGTDSFTYTVCDNGNPRSCDTATVTVTVTPVNDAPNAVNDRRTVNEDSGATVIGVRANDTDADGDTLTVTGTTQPANGTVTLTDGVVRYTPNDGFNGTDTFTYTIGDGNGGTDTATVTITVTPVNDPVTAEPDRRTIDEDGILEIPAPELTANDSAGDAGQTLTVTQVGQPSNGTVRLENGIVTYTPDDDFNGTDSFTYTVCDDGSPQSCDTATVTVTVNPINDAPNATNDSADVDEDDTVNISVLTNDTDPDGRDDLDPSSVRVVTGPANGTSTVGSDGSISYTPDEDFEGTDTLTYEVCDDAGDCDTATVTITVGAVNDAPNAVNNSARATEGGDPVSVNALANDTDPDGDTLTIADFTQPASGEGTVELVNGRLVYTPNDDFNGVTSFEYTVSDGNGGTDTATVTITVTPVNDAVTAEPDSRSVDEDGTLRFRASTLTSNDSAGDAGQSLTVTEVGRPENGTVTLVNGVVTYRPNAGYSGSDSFSYTVCDDGTPRDCATSTVNVTVTPVNDTPDAVADSARTLEDRPVTVDVLANDEDPDGPEGLDRSSLSITTPPANGTARVEDGRIVYTPDANFSGTDTLTYRVCDTGEPQSCDEARVRITVRPVNDPPTAGDDRASATEDGPPVFIDVRANDDTSPDSNESLTVTSVTQPPEGRGTVSIVPAGSPNAGQIRYTPGPDYSGSVTFTYTVSDGNSGTATATVTVNVAPTNDDPTAAPDSATAEEDGDPVRIDVLDNDSFSPDRGETLTITSVTQPPAGEGSVRISDGAVFYTPPEDFEGETTFEYTISDGNGGTATTTVTVTVGGNNSAPVTNPDRATVREDSTLTLSPDRLLGNDSSGDNGQTLRITEVGQAQNGSVRISDSGDVIYTPNPNFNGTDSFTYTVCDDGTPEKCATSEVTVTVTPVNDAPTADDERTEVRAGQSVTVNVLDGDRPGPDNESGQTLTITETGQPEHGRAEVVDGRIVYTPNPDYSGPDSFTYTVCDSGSPRKCATATVEVNVLAANAPPVARDDSAKTAFGKPVKVSVLGNDRDDSGLDRSSLKVTTQPKHGSVRVNTDGTVTYTPRNGFVGKDTFKYEICDNGSPVRCDTATVSVTVAPPPRADLAIDIDAPARVKLGDNFTYTLTVTNNGPDTARNVVVRSVLPESVRFVRAPDNCTYNPKTRTVTCKLGTMADGTVKEPKIVVKAIKAGTVSLRACTVTSDTADPNGSNDGVNSGATMQRSSSTGVDNPQTTVVAPQSDADGA